MAAIRIPERRRIRAAQGRDTPTRTYQLARAWINTAEAVRAAAQAHREDGADRVLLINASPRSEHTCPGEMSKSYRLAQIAQSVFVGEQAQVDVLDLSRLFIPVAIAAISDRAGVKVDDDVIGCACG